MLHHKIVRQRCKYYHFNASICRRSSFQHYSIEKNFAPQLLHRQLSTAKIFSDHGVTNVKSTDSTTVHAIGPVKRSVNLFGGLAMPSVSNVRVSSERKVLSSFLFWLSQRGADFRYVDIRPLAGTYTNTPDISVTSSRPIDDDETKAEWGVFMVKEQGCVPGDVLMRIPYSATLGITPTDFRTNFSAETAALESGSTSSEIMSPSSSSVSAGSLANTSTNTKPQLSFGESFSELLQLIPAELTDLRLGVRLLSERCRVYQKQFSWWPYIGALPLYVNGVPVFFSAPQLYDLQYAPIQVQVKRKCLTVIKLAEVINNHYKHLFYGHTVDSHSLAWAMSATSSRAFGLGAENKRLVPLLDMINHSFTPNVKVGLRPTAATAPTGTASISTVGVESLAVADTSSELESMVLEVTALTALKPGDELSINYGHLTNDQFLLLYGFLPGVRDSARLSRDALSGALPSGSIGSSGETSCGGVGGMIANPYDAFQLVFDANLLAVAADLGAGETGQSPLAVILPQWKRDLIERLNIGGTFPIPTEDVIDEASTSHRVRPDSARDEPAVRIQVEPDLTPSKSSPSFYIRPLESGGMDMRLLALLRIIFAEKELEIQEDESTNEVLERWQSAGCVDHFAEINAIRCLYHLISLLLQSYPTTLEHDQKLLSNGDLTDVTRLAIWFRLGKKLILQQHLQLLTTILQ